MSCIIYLARCLDTAPASTASSGPFRVQSKSTPTRSKLSISIFKRGMKGVYQHCKEKHLHRYLAEFDFRYSHRVRLGYSDEACANVALKGIVEKR
jgi:hypothetical protein